MPFDIDMASFEDALKDALSVTEIAIGAANVQLPERDLHRLILARSSRAWSAATKELADLNLANKALEEANAVVRGVEFELPAFFPRARVHTSTRIVEASIVLVSLLCIIAWLLFPRFAHSTMRTIFITGLSSECLVFGFTELPVIVYNHRKRKAIAHQRARMLDELRRIEEEYDRPALREAVIRGRKAARNALLNKGIIPELRSIIEEYATQRMSAGDHERSSGRIEDKANDDDSRGVAKDIMTGSMKWFDQLKGYGFITAESGEEIFVHHASITTKGNRTFVDGIAKGQSVIFEDVKSTKGPQQKVFRVSSPVPPVPPPEHPQEQLLRVFLCHASADKTRVRELYHRLTKQEVAPWLDEENLLPGQDWEREIRKQVRTADAVVCCLSKDSITREGFVQREITYALDAADEKPEGTIYLIPLRLEECVVPDRLSRWQWVDVFHAQGYSRLVRSLEIRAGELGRKMPLKA